MKINERTTKNQQENKLEAFEVQPYKTINATQHNKLRTSRRVENERKKKTQEKERKGFSNRTSGFAKLQ